MVLSRGARRCLKILRRYARRYNCVFPYRSTIAKELDVSPRQFDRYISELKLAGLVTVSQSGPQPANYQIDAGQNGEATSKLRRSNVEASRFAPYINRRITQEEMRARFPMEVETPSPEVVGLLEWADANGYPTSDGAQLEAAERAFKLRKPPGIARSIREAVAK